MCVGEGHKWLVLHFLWPGRRSTKQIRPMRDDINLADMQKAKEEKLIASSYFGNYIHLYPISVFCCWVVDTV